MNTDFNLKSPSAFTHNKRISLYIEASKPGTDFSSLAEIMKVVMLNNRFSI